MDADGNSPEVGPAGTPPGIPAERIAGSAAPATSQPAPIESEAPSDRTSDGTGEADLPIEIGMFDANTATESAAVAPQAAAAAAAAGAGAALTAGAEHAPIAPQGSPVPRERPVARKEYYSISEVCDLVGLRPHVLRYWETQFPVLNPSKNRSGNRVYQRKEIRLILLVKNLLYEEKYTVEGAKQKLEQLRKGGELQAATRGALDRQMVSLLKSEMHYLMEVLTPPRAQG